MTTFDWILIGVFGAAALALLIVFLVKFFKLNKAQRKELLIQFLVGLVTTAEGLFTESKAGPQRLQWVEEQFQQKAPTFLKILLLVTNCGSLQELVEAALERAKTTVFDAAHKQEQE